MDRVGAGRFKTISLVVSQEKKRDKYFGLRKKDLTVKGHNFVLRQYDQVDNLFSYLFTHLIFTY